MSARVRIDDVSALFGVGADARFVALTSALDDDAIAGLWPREREAVAHAVGKRQRELATGRALARAALARLGVAACEIPSGADRAPVWPEGIAGSITHSDVRAIVALGARAEIGSIGIDLEEGPVLAEELWRPILLADERERLEREPEEGRGRSALIVFAAKEALYKAQHPISRRFMGFHELSVELVPEGEMRGALRCTFRADVPPFARGTIAHGVYRVGALGGHEVVVGVRIPPDAPHS